MSKAKRKGWFGDYGGSFVPETLVEPLRELDAAYARARGDRKFRAELSDLLSTFVGRPTPMSFAPRLSEKLGIRLFLKREDLAHTAAHTINNPVGQARLARRRGNTRVSAETGAGQHGVAAAAAAARLGLSCSVFMGTEDMRRQAPNVERMRLLGAEVVPVASGSRTLKDATSQALREWSSSFEGTAYILGSVLGPHPYPSMVRDFQLVIGREARPQILKAAGRLPYEVVACVGGGSNAIGIFSAFRADKGVRLTGVEGGGLGIKSGLHAARFSGGRPGVLHGCLTYLLQDAHGQVRNTHSVSAGLDYPAVGPEHVFLRRSKRASYTHESDKAALKACRILSETEGILPALECAHALAYVLRRRFPRNAVILVNLSGRGDKDLASL